MFNLLGVQIANGFSPEARVFASLLSYRDDRYSARVLHQWWGQDRESAGLFEQMAAMPVERVDVGFRYSPAGLGRIPVQAVARARLAIAMRQLREYARSAPVDLVYANQQRWDSGIGASLARSLSRPLVIHLHYNVGPWLGRGIVDRLQRAAHIVTVSDFIREQVLAVGVPAERVTTVRNTMTPAAPIDAGTRDAVRAELQIPENARLIGCVARLDRWKGQADAIAAFAAISDRFPNLWLLLAGDGDIRADLERQAARSGVSNRVVFAGFRDDVPRVLAALDIFLHPALSDPCPLGVLEAAAAGLPVVGYEHGGMPELVAHGRTGLLVPANDLGALADALATLAQDAERARSFGLAGRARIKSEFRPEDAGAKFADVLAGVAARAA